MRIKSPLMVISTMAAGLLIVLKEYCFVPTGQRRDIIRYACNFFAVNGGVVILK